MKLIQVIKFRPRIGPTRTRHHGCLVRSTWRTRSFPNSRLHRRYFWRLLCGDREPGLLPKISVRALLSKGYAWAPVYNAPRKSTPRQASWLKSINVRRSGTFVIKAYGTGTDPSTGRASCSIRVDVNSRAIAVVRWLFSRELAHDSYVPVILKRNGTR